MQYAVFLFVFYCAELAPSLILVLIHATLVSVSEGVIKGGTGGKINSLFVD